LQRRRIAKSNALVVLVVAICALYFWRLDDAPLGMDRDEAWFAIHAKSIGSTGRDLNGVAWPLLIQPAPELGTDLWYQPLLFYLDALAFLVFPVSEWSARLPMALMGILCVWLTFRVGQHLHESREWGLVCACLMASTPSLFVFSRQAVDYLLPVPFVLGALWCLLKTLETDRRRFAAGAGVLLGAGLFTYISAWLMMPLFVIVTLITLAASGKSLRLMVAAALGFALPGLVLAGWLAAHREVLPTIIDRYQLPGGTEGLRAILHYYRLLDLLSDYWSTFNPVHLFFVMSADPRLGTHAAGVFLAPMAVFLACGSYAIVRRADRTSVLLAGFLLAPLATVISHAPAAVQRELLLIPFGVLIASLGLRLLTQQRSRLAAVLTPLTVAGIAVHFALFGVDYFSRHNSFALSRRDPLNIRALSQALLKLDSGTSAPAIHLALTSTNQRATWEFEMAKPRNSSLAARTRFVPNEVPAASLMTNDLIVLPDLSVSSERLAEMERTCLRVGQVETATESSPLGIWRRR
jgi:4-amino-4-deoxy-L-arabinose transferase-like glycosyltransferase